MAKSVAIIGSGIAGLASAIHLAKAGFHVSVYEKIKVAGGKISEIKAKKYRFDTGPSLFTLPELYLELFENINKEDINVPTLKKLDIVCKYFYPDGTNINSYNDPDKFAKEIEQKTNVPGQKIVSFLDKAKELYNLTSKLFIFSSFHKLKTFNTPEAKKILPNLHKLNFTKTMHGQNKKYFNNDHITQLFDRYATYNGSNPYKAPATLNIISHLEHNLGAFLPEKGMRILIEKLIDLANYLGVEIKTDKNVTEIIYTKKGVQGVKINDHKYSHDIVISNCDINPTYKYLLKKKLPLIMRKQELSSSAIIFYWGIKKEFHELSVHNILFSGNYKEEFRHIFKKKIVYHDPTVYIYISSKINKDDAPTDCENWFCMINVPNNTNQDWNVIVEEARANIINKIKLALKTDITKYIEFEEYSDPVKIEQQTSSYRGALYGPSSNSKFSAFLRHANFSRKIKNLYFVGGSVHPGGGIPLCLASAKITSRLIKDENE